LNIPKKNRSNVNDTSTNVRRKRTCEELWDAADQAALEGDISANNGEYEQALHAYAQALEICPSNPDLWVFTAITLQGGLHRDEQALAAWKRAQELDPTIREAFSEQNRDITDLLPKKIGGSCRNTLRHLAEDDSADPRC
jgi:tetratricopeptide (TPR) repeat protein